MTPREWGAPRVSDHSWQGPTGTPSGPTGTVLAHCPVHDTATTRPGSITPDPRARRAEAVMRSHHRSASWVAPPSALCTVDTARCSVQAMVPVNDTRPTLGPPVPWSTARTHASPRPPGVAVVTAGRCCAPP